MEIYTTKRDELFWKFDFDMSFMDGNEKRYGRLSLSTPIYMNLPSENPGRVEMEPHGYQDKNSIETPSDALSAFQRFRSARDRFHMIPLHLRIL